MGSLLRSGQVSGGGSCGAGANIQKRKSDWMGITIKFNLTAYLCLTVVLACQVLDIGIHPPCPDMIAGRALPDISHPWIEDCPHFTLFIGQPCHVSNPWLAILLLSEGYGKKTDGSKIGGDMGQDGERRKTYSAAVIEGFKRNSAIYVGDSIVRKTDSRLNKGEDVVVCLPGARIEHVTARVEKIMGRGKGGTILVHIGTNNADKEGTTAIVDKYSKLLKKTKEARVGQIILSGILPVFGNRIDGYRNSKRMAINGMVKRLCKEEDVGYVDLWDSFVGKEEMYLRDGLHLSGKGLPFLPRDSQGRLPVAWVKYDI